MRRHSKIGSVIDKKIDIVNDQNLPDLIVKKSNIEFSDVSFNYEKTKEKAVKNLNLKIQEIQWLHL